MRTYHAIYRPLQSTDCFFSSATISCNSTQSCCSVTATTVTQYLLLVTKTKFSIDSEINLLFLPVSSSRPRVDHVWELLELWRWNGPGSKPLLTSLKNLIWHLRLDTSLLCLKPSSGPDVFNFILQNEHYWFYFYLNPIVVRERIS